MREFVTSQPLTRRIVTNSAGWGVGGVAWGRSGGGGREGEAGGGVVGRAVDEDRVAVGHLTREHHLREPVTDLLLHEPAQRTCTDGRVVTLEREPLARRVAHLEREAPALEAPRAPGDQQGG